MSAFDESHLPPRLHEAAARVLAGRAPYDELDGRAQAFVRGVWAERIAEQLDGLDFTERLRAAGQPWPEADAEGNVVMRDAGPSG